MLDSLTGLNERCIWNSVLVLALMSLVSRSKKIKKIKIKKDLSCSSQSRRLKSTV